MARGCAGPAMGTNLIYHLAGGETGMRHMLAQFGPALKWPWTKLEAPELTETLIDRMVEGTQAAGGGPFDPRARAAARQLSRRDPAGAAAVRYRRRLDAARAGGAAVPGRRGANAPAAAGRASRCRGSRRVGEAGVGRLQRPHVRFPLRPCVRRGYGCALSRRRRRRGIPQDAAGCFTPSRAT